jgi:hypothetical protein
MTITVTKTFTTEAEAAAWLSGTGTTNTPAPAPVAEKAAAPAPATKPTAKPAAKKPASEHSKEEMVAALTELKDTKGKDAAKAVIKDVGGVDKMADIPDDKIDAVYEAAKAAMTAEDDGM